MHKNSNRTVLRRLVRDHPDWTYQQYADHLGQKVSTIRGALSKMGLSRNLPKTPKPKKKMKFPKETPQPPEYRVFSYCGPRRNSGYLKLM